MKFWKNVRRHANMKLNWWEWKQLESIFGNFRFLKPSPTSQTNYFFSPDCKSRGKRRNYWLKYERRNTRRQRNQQLSFSFKNFWPLQVLPFYQKFLSKLSIAYILAKNFAHYEHKYFSVAFASITLSEFIFPQNYLLEGWVKETRERKNKVSIFSLAYSIHYNFAEIELGKKSEGWK